MNRFDRTIHICNLLVQFFILVAVVFYAVESRRLRIQTETQVSLLQRQDRTSGTPSLVAGLTEFDPAERKRWIDYDSNMPASERKIALERLAKKKPKFSVIVSNYSNPIAQNLQAVLYDASTRSFLICDEGKEVLSAQSSDTFDFASPYKSASEAADWIVDRYGSAAAYIRDLVTVQNLGYIAIIFQDAQGRTYFLQRSFDKPASEGPSYFPSVLHSPP